MKRDNINYLVVGTFVLVVFAVLMVFLYQLTGRGGPSDIYTVIYNNVAGIKFGTPVLYEGYQVGQVESIQPVHADEGMRYKLELSVTKDWRIPSDSVAQVVASGLLSAMTIEIKEGESERMLEPGSEIKGSEAVNIFAAINDVAANFRELSDDSVRPLLNTLAVNIEKLTDELIQLAREDIRPVFNNLDRKINQAEFVEQTNQLVAKLNVAAEGLQNMLNEGNQEHVSSTVDNLQSGLCQSQCPVE
ncbi:MAG: MlaD family protein [Gammaproteobacteria bacterium]|nr:MlaD family protein [Gammaproteobacteria bacterium]